MRRAALALAVLLAACACPHARDARAIRDGAELVIDMTSVALVRSLTETEAATLERARGQLREHAAAFVEDTQ